MSVHLQTFFFHKKNYNEYLKFICYFIILLLPTHYSFGIQQQKNGITVIDLQKTPIHKNTEIALDSGWEFYWNQLIEPNNFKNNKTFEKVSLNNWTHFKFSNNKKLPSFGYATYRLNISIPKERPHISLYIPAAYASSKTWINGKLISKIGHVGISKSETKHRRFSQIVSLNTHETNFEIVIQVANFYHNKGGIDKPLLLGTTKHLNNLKIRKIIADMIFIGCLGFIGTFFLLFFLFYWNKDRAVLYFGIACVSLAYMALSDRYAPFTVIFESISWFFLTKIEYTSLFLAGTTASLFFYTIFSDFTHRLYPKALIYSFFILSILVIFLPAPYFTKLVFPFLILMIINLIYVTYIIIKSFIGKLHDSLLLLVSMLLGSIVFYVHIFVFLGKKGDAIIYVNFGYILVFLLLSMLLMIRFSNSFKELEIAKEFALEQKKEISIKSNELSNLNLELKANLKQLEDYNTELDSFNHIVSHDLKAPLVAMHTLVSFIEEDLEAVLDKNATNHFNLLKDKISKMNALINGLLEYSKIAKGNKRKDVFSLNKLLNEVIESVNPQDRNTITLPIEDIEINTSRIELEHVFQNLISNAIKYNDKESAKIKISVSKLEKEYLFSVSDNGPGIDPKYHTKIFEMFSQLNVNDEIESTGIGLSIVKKIVTANHGIISVESEKGTGTNIKFSWKI